MSLAESSDLGANKSAGGDIFERDRALDGVRGIAIGMILLLHGFLPIWAGPLSRFITVVLDSMTLGVDLFFVLSGFLITTILIRTRAGTGYFRNFYARRALRIFPAYYLVMVWVFVIRPAIDMPPWQTALNQAAPYYLSYTQNLIMAWRGTGLGWDGLQHTWSLAIEEQFYWLWPAIIWLAPKERLLRVCLLLYVGLTAIKFALYATGVSWITIYVSPLTHSGGLVVGAILAAWLATKPMYQPPRWFRVVGIASCAGFLVELVIAFIGIPSYESHHMVLIALSELLFAWIICEVLTAERKTVLRRVLQTAPLIFLGRYSYGIYLIHVVVLYDLRTAWLHDWQATMGGNLGIAFSGALGIAISIVLAMAMYHIIEHPILRLKRYFVSTTKHLAPIRITE